MKSNINNNDIIIIKNAQSWASRSIAKISSFRANKLGSNIRLILDHSVNVKKSLQESYNTFTILSNKTMHDYDALAMLSNIRLILDSIYFEIVKVVIPALQQDKIDIVEYYKQQQSQEEPAKQEPPKKTKLHTEEQQVVKEKPIQPEVTPDGYKKIEIDQLVRTKTDLFVSRINELIKQVKNLNLKTPNKEFETDKSNLIMELSVNLNEIKKGKQIEEVEEIYNLLNADVLDILDKFAELNKTSLIVYEGILKNSNLRKKYLKYVYARYGKIKTPIREFFLDVKQFIPGLIEKRDIHVQRNSVITSVKVLIKKSSAFIKTIISEISDKDELVKWSRIINAYNEFATLYNQYIENFSNFYEILRIKAKQDKMKKSIKELKGKQKKQEYILSDFIETTWADLPSTYRSKFKRANIITFNV